MRRPRRRRKPRGEELAVAFPGDLVALLLPEVAPRIDLGQLRFESKEYFLDTPQGRRRFPDLVARARGRSHPHDEALLHVEHFSRYLSVSRVRLWDYNRVLGIRYGLPSTWRVRSRSPGLWHR